MELFLLRHGIPVEPENWNGMESARPLTPRGRTQTQAVIEALQTQHGLAVDHIWSSPYVRCQETARIAADLLKVPCDFILSLASGANLLTSLLKSQGDAETWPARLLCVGHQPDLGILVSLLTDDAYGSYAFGRAGCARLTGEFMPGGMKLEWMLTAEEALR